MYLKTSQHLVIRPDSSWMRLMVVSLVLQTNGVKMATQQLPARSARMEKGWALEQGHKKVIVNGVSRYRMLFPFILFLKFELLSILHFSSFKSEKKDENHKRNLKFHDFRFTKLYLGLGMFLGFV